jgi:hypothetical protein
MNSEQTPKQRLVAEFGHRQVNRVIELDNWAAEVIFDIAAGDKTKWTPIEWAAVICDLERCKLKVIDWVEAS